jgi:FtsP/CotA-like multicopper oxidase with cupredoxin domain
MTILIATMLAGAAVPPPADYRFEIARAKGALYNPWTLSDDQVELRSFVGSGARPGDFVAPTIRIAPGQELNIGIDNRLEPCSEAQRAAETCFNDTNLHTHGMWVSPSGHSDNVLISIAPGSSFQYHYEVPADHPAGTFWYHPHSHGSGFVQVGSGMAGALIVTGNRLPTENTPGDVDILLKDERGRPFPERVMIFQQIKYACLDKKGQIEGQRDKDNNLLRPLTCASGEVGRIEGFDNDESWRRTGRFTGINGKVQPELSEARAGGFERWRMINAGSGEPMRMRLYSLDAAAPPLRTVKAADQVAWRERFCTGQPLPMWQIALDGLTRSAIRKVDEAILFAGQRMDVIARLPEPGRYCMVNDTRPDDPKQLNPSRMVAVVDAKGAVAPDPGGDATLESTLLHSAEKALAGRDRSTIRAYVVDDLRDGLKLTSFDWHKPIPDSEVSGYREVLINIIDGPAGASFRVNGQVYDDNRIDAVLPLGKAEEWHATALIEDHPLHIHVNPFQVVAIEDPEGRDATDPKSPAFDPDYAGLKGEWMDTVLVKKDMRVACRTRYERFTGDFVTHCHIMYHGDHGMMQNLRIAETGDAAPPHAMH